MSRFFTVAALAMILLALPGSAGRADTGRYTMKQTEDGFLRLDTETGAVSMCGRQDGRWRCEALADDKLALEHEIERLSRENTELKSKLALRGTGEKRKLELPSEQEIDEAISFVERMIRKFKKAMKNLRENEAPGTPL